MAGWLADWLAGRLVGWLAAWLLDSLADWLFCGLAASSVAGMVSWPYVNISATAPPARRACGVNRCLPAGSPPSGWKAFRKFESFFWISTFRLEMLPEIRLHLLENLTDSHKNLLKVSSLSGASIPEILKMQPLSFETSCFDPNDIKCKLGQPPLTSIVLPPCAPTCT